MVSVKSTAIDPLTGNVYYVDADTQTINVINSNGQYTKTLTSPTNRSTSWKIEHMALDIVNKYALKNVFCVMKPTKIFIILAVLRRNA